jgi:AIPR protein
VYVTNKIFDQNAKEYLNTTEIDAYDNQLLFEKYTYMVEADVLNTPKILDLTNSSAIQYNAALDNNSIVLAVPVKQLLKLDGIQDHSLFSRNVRLWTGKTRVNKELASTISDQTEHSRFFLYHNGVSITCSNFVFSPNENKIEISGYQVINGCQSIVSFYQNRTNLTDNILVLTKIIKVAPQSPLIQKITKNANNQNAISAKDLKSNDRVQLSLQRKFLEIFNNTVLYMIKRGENTIGYTDVIEIDFAAQLITSFYFDEPYKTHLKNNFYGEDYEKIFSRNTSCQRIFLAYRFINY